VALITGGGTGIGRGIARAYLAHGAAVCISSRKQEVIDAAAAELAADTGGKVMAMAADVREPEQLAAVVAATVQRFGKLDTLVNNAAGNFLSPAAALSPKGFKTVVDIDLAGCFNASKAAFAALCEAKDGLILNISATLRTTHPAGRVGKAGIDSLTRTFAVEWGSSGIRCVAIAPGPIGDTEGMRRLAPGDVAQRMAKTIPLGRFGRIDEIADAAVFLRSPAAAYITGTILVVDGGQCVSIPAFTGT
jgi:peroxisomal 2,4-dienoyl-CoA reductase